MSKPQAQDDASVTAGEHILRHRVPPAVEQAAAVARRYRDGTASLIDVMEQEAKLRCLVEDVMAAHAQTASYGSLRTDEFEVVEMEPGRRCMATAPMAFCPEAVLMVHAPIMMGRVAAIAERLAVGQKIIGLQNVFIRKPVWHDTVIVVASGAGDIACGTAGDLAVRGQVLCSNGDVLRFAVYEDVDKPVALWIDNGEIARLFRPHKSAHDGAEFSFAVEAVQAGGSPIPHSHAIQLLLEAMMRGIVFSRRTDSRALLLTKIESLRWPKNLGDVLARGLELGLWLRRPARGGASKGDWHRLAMCCAELSEMPCIEADFKGVEGHVRFSDLFI